tara:strand:- start:4825 stop:5025 length:201 start_codon:yes stop_codon:yes gene_type:complete
MQKIFTDEAVHEVCGRVVADDNHQRRQIVNSGMQTRGKLLQHAGPGHPVSVGQLDSLIWVDAPRVD